MKFLLVKPGFHNSHRHKLYLTSVAGQPGVVFEHIVPDSGREDSALEGLVVKRVHPEMKGSR